MESQSDLPLPVRLALATPDYAPTWQWSPMRYLGASPTTTQHVADSVGTSLRSLRAALIIIPLPLKNSASSSLCSGYSNIAIYY